MDNIEVRYVYYLADPRDGMIRWVGMTLYPAHRWHTHTAATTTNAGLKAWMLDLRAQGLRPVMGILEQVSTHSAYNLKVAERRGVGVMDTGCDCEAASPAVPTQEKNDKA
jgi:hypothetical protein